MDNKKLSGVPDTLFIPLMARIYISKRFPEYFHDEKALSLEKLIPQNIITEKSSEYAMMGSASRAVNMDKIVAEFAHKNSNCNVVCIGCGLETMAFRLKNLSDKAHFYEIDFTSVIENRKTVLGELTNETLIEGNANELDFSQHMDCTKPTIFVVAGVFQYFKENEVLALISKLQSQFKNAEILFDAVDEFGVKYAERYVKKTGNKDATLYFYINNPKEFANKTNTKLISANGFYGGISKELRKKLKLYTKIATKIADSKMHAMILRFKLSGANR